jgi:peroxiredoxin
MSTAEERYRAHAPDVGERAPDFVLRDTTGAERTLTDLVHDRRQVVIFYRGHW